MQFKIQMRNVICAMCGRLRQSGFTTSTITKRLISHGSSSRSEKKDSKSIEMNDNNHMNITAHSNRQDRFYKVHVEDIKQISPSVKRVTLSLAQEDYVDFTFKAGQWVDMIIPKVDVVGGFSMCNTPRDLHENHRLVFAVKFSEHPPAHWVHTQCRTGSKVEVRVGGNFFCDSTSDDKPLLLIAGGVGINPIFSIFQHRRDVMTSSRTPAVKPMTSLIYGAKTVNELLFKRAIEAICDEADTSATCQFHVSREPTPPGGHRNRRVDYRKMSQESLRRTFHANPALLSEADCFLCGPRRFIESCERHLTALGFDVARRLFYEKWW